MIALASLLIAGAMSPHNSLVVKHIGSLNTLQLGSGSVFRETKAVITAPHVLAVPGSSAQLALWNENGSLFYGISLNGQSMNRVAESSNLLRLRYQTFDPLVAVPEVPVGMRAGAANELYIVQFVSQALPEFSRAIAEAGGQVQHYLADQSYICRIDQASLPAVRNLPYVRWVGPYEPAYRLDPTIAAELSSGKLGTNRYNIQANIRESNENALIGQKITAIGGQVDNVLTNTVLLEATLTPAQLKQVLQWNEVFWIDRWSAPEPDMDIARQIGGANYIEGIGGYAGQGVRGEVMDGNVRDTHVDFNDNGRSILFHNGHSGDASHGTCTTGIVFGSGTGNAQGRGMLPKGQTIFADYELLTNRFNHSNELVHSPYFGVFQSNSWGDAQTTQYTSKSFEMDDIIFRLDLLICQSQSNTGNQTSRPQAWAKNIVSVGGVVHQNTLTKADDSWGGASIGPAADGRIKPDLTHFYDNVFCTYYTGDTAYTSGFNGTSAATPITAGHFGLLFQMWADGVYGNSVSASTVFDAKCHAATAKAIMINQASQYPLTQGSLGRFKQGWGLPDLKNQYDNRNNLFIVDEAELLQNLQTKSYRLYVPAATPEFHATMIYPDPPGTTSSTLHRINDLSLKVTAPDGTIYWGNNGLTTSNYSTSGGISNTIDTVENVIVQNPPVGTWTVEVRADQIVQDGWTATPEFDATYALVVGGVAHTSRVRNLTPLDSRITGGTIDSLATSNNDYLSVQPISTPTLSRTLNLVEVTGLAPVFSLTELRFRTESNSNANAGSGIQRLALYNFRTGFYDVLDTTPLTLTDTVREVVVTSNPTDYVDPNTLEVRSRLQWERTGVALFNPTFKFDQVRWFFKS